MSLLYAERDALVICWVCLYQHCHAYLPDSMTGLPEVKAASRILVVELW